MEYRLANVRDTDRLSELRWQDKSEGKPLDITQKEPYIRYCSDHFRTRFGNDLTCWVAEDSGVIVAHI